MTQIRFVTLTGAGEKTNFAHMVRLSERFPFTEWGVLYSPGRAGRENRYPSLEWLEKFADKAQKQRLNIALYLCGQGAEDVLATAGVVHKARTVEMKRLMALAEKFDRIQLNIRAKAPDIDLFERLARNMSYLDTRPRVILQWNSHNEPVCKELGHLGVPGVEFAVDSSGERGQVCEQWPQLDPTVFRRLGYAGGLGPDNIRAQLVALTEVQAGRSFWVDMESKLRDEQDGFSLDRCEDVLLQTEGFLNEQRYKEATLWRAGWRTVDNLEGLWLDWWAGAAVGVSLVVPPKDACAAMRLVRRTGNFERYSPGAHISSLERLLHGENIALRAFSTGWRAGCATLVSGGEKALEASGPDIATAGLRAIVAKHFGHTVPCQPLLDLATRQEPA
jgi:phosphoribosylanthranilate isomerase